MGTAKVRPSDNLGSVSLTVLLSPALWHTICGRFFLVLEKRGRLSSSVTTHELNALNSRLRDAAADCIMLTVQVRVRQHMCALCWGMLH
jgi:hypothetical protein